MRGLKPLQVVLICCLFCRIFYRCVDWNFLPLRRLINSKVASFTDAWIETLKLVGHPEEFEVASFTDAWIETPIKHLNYIMVKSRIFYRCVDWNFETCRASRRVWVASFTDAWIETIEKGNFKCSFDVASFTDAWIETLPEIIFNLKTESHLLQMRGLKLFALIIKEVQT